MRQLRSLVRVQPRGLLHVPLSSPWWRATAFAAVYGLAVELGYGLSLGPTVGATFWPPSGVALAVLLATPWRSWAGWAACALSVSVVLDAWHGFDGLAPVGFGVANLVEPVLTALVFRWLFPTPSLARVVELAALVAIEVLLAAPISAALGAATAAFFTADHPGFYTVWRTWWVGNASGAVVLGPLVFRLVQEWGPIRARLARSWPELVALGVVLVVVTQLVFAAPPSSVAPTFLVFPVLLWSSLRFGLVGVGGALSVIVLMTTLDTAAGHGPFAGADSTAQDRLVSLQLYVGVLALSFQSLGVLWEEHRRALSALRTAHLGIETRYRRVVEQAPLALLVLSPKGAVREANRAWVDLWGSPSEHRRQEWWDPLAEPFARAVAGDPPHAFLVAVEEPTRRVRRLVYPVRSVDGGLQEVVVIDRDVSAEVRAQEALELALTEVRDAKEQRERLLDAERSARSEAERASRLKDEFLATLSHELRSPLNAVLGWVQVLRRKPPDAPTLARAIDIIERNANAQSKLIDDLLEMSRIVAGKVTLAREQVRVVEWVRPVVESFRPTAEAKNVALTARLDAVEETVVAGDAARLRQILVNLVGNALKFTPSGGAVVVGATVNGSEVQVRVRDTGKGIPAEFLPVVFERFRQADGSTTRQHGGLGLGLSIARQLVELHGGRIEAASEGVDRGATFTVSLPVAEPARGPEAPATIAPVRLTGRRLLVVDDDPDAREVMARLLAEHDNEVVVAGSAAEALATLDAYDAEVLLSDISMPEMDGYELIARVRASGNGLFAVAVTAFARPEDIARAIAAGFDAHVAKPVDAEALARVARAR